MRHKANQFRMVDGKLVPFNSYQACPPTASDEQVSAFLSNEEIRQCRLRPALKIPFHHRDPIGQCVRRRR